MVPRNARTRAASGGGKRWGLLAGAALCTVMSHAPQALAQTATPDAAPNAVNEIVVTGFRASLRSSIEQKRTSTEIADVITAEDIGKFPDLNLAESLQRVPGVQIDRDGGEGRTITVRGLSADFVRVRLNGLEALATTGGRDGRANRNRSFDFNVFASELFSNVKVSKSQSAETDEGSLGATVDLTTGHPLDKQGFQFVVGGKLGVLLSGAYSRRELFEEGMSAGGWRVPLLGGGTPTDNTCFTSATASPTAAQSPALRNFDCVSGPITLANGTVVTGAEAAAAVDNAAHPRIPRYGRLSYDRERTGLTGSVQFKPFAGTKITWDSLYALLKEVRQEEYLEVIGFAREGNLNGLRDSEVVSGTIDGSGTLVKGVFNDVDIRSEQRRDHLATEFMQSSLVLEQDVTDRLRAKVVYGYSRSKQDNPLQETLSLDRYNVDGYSYDYTNMRAPKFNYGFDVSDPNNWTYSSSNTFGDQSLIRVRPNKAINEFESLKADLTFDATDWLTLKVGASQKLFSFRGWEARRPNDILSPTTTAGLAAAGIGIDKYSTAVTGLTISGAPNAWVVPSIDALKDIIDFGCNCTNAWGDFRVSIDNVRSANIGAKEKSNGAYVQGDWDLSFGGVAVRGNAGVRYVETTAISNGFTSIKLTADPAVVTQVTAVHKYKDTLPAVNLTVEPFENVLVRAAYAKTLARPSLPALPPSGSIDFSKSPADYNTGNPFLEPIRSTNYDLALEWYPWKEAQFSFAVFRKDMASYIQRLTVSSTLDELGLDPTAFGATNATLVNANTFINTNGGKLTGFEINLQTPFTILPGVLKNFGGILNYSKIKSEFEYVVSPATATNAVAANLAGWYRCADPRYVSQYCVKDTLFGQSPSSLAATLYYSQGPFEGRVSATYRESYLSGVDGGANTTGVFGKEDSLNWDMSATWSVSDRLSLSIEGVNLTDQYDERYTTSKHLLNNYEHTGREIVAGFRFKY